MRAMKRFTSQESSPVEKERNLRNARECVYFGAIGQAETCGQALPWWRRADFPPNFVRKT